MATAIAFDFLGAVNQDPTPLRAFPNKILAAYRDEKLTKNALSISPPMANNLKQRLPARSSTYPYSNSLQLQPILRLAALRSVLTR